MWSPAYKGAEKWAGRGGCDVTGGALLNTVGDTQHAFMRMGITSAGNKNNADEGREKQRR